MTTPCSGQITLANVASELGRSNSNISLNDADVRGLAGKPSGQIALADLRCKSNLCGNTGDIIPAMSFSAADTANKIWTKNAFSTGGPSFQYNGMHFMASDPNTHYATEGYKHIDSSTSTFFRMSANNSTALTTLCNSSTSGYVNQASAFYVDVTPSDCGYTSVKIKDFQVSARWGYNNTYGFRTAGALGLYTSTVIPSSTGTRSHAGTIYMPNGNESSSGDMVVTTSTARYMTAARPSYTTPFYIILTWYLQGQRMRIVSGSAQGGNPREYTYIITLEYS